MHRTRVLPTLPSLLSTPGRPLIHRDLSWLQFNERVLDEARSGSGNPLLERVKFLAITASNLDEFFMIRFASLGRQIRLLTRPHKAGTDGHPRRKSADLIRAKRLQSIRNAILEAVLLFGSKQTEVLTGIQSELDAAGIHLVKDATASPVSLELGKQIFESEILPKLSAPETFEMAKLALLENQKIAAVYPDGLMFRITRTLPMTYPGRSPDGKLFFFFLDDLLLAFLGPSFGLKGRPAFVRLTRDADFTAEIGDLDPATMPDLLRSKLSAREKGAPVRLQYSGETTPAFLDAAASALKLVPGQVVPAPSTLCLHGLWRIYNHQSPEVLNEKANLRYASLEPRLPRELSGPEGVFEALKKRDVLLHHPYDTFDAFVAWVRAAANDPDVVLIEQTIYRMDRDCPLIDVLKSAAATKRVRVIIELRARFDELNNLRLADDLRKAGVEVAFGFGKLKLHAKVTLVTRMEEGKPRLYSHLSTGNYNAVTARSYTDLAILTAHPEVGDDARKFFDAAWAGKVPQRFKRLVSAPTKLHKRLLDHITRETEAARRGEKTHIVAKVNALVDENVIDALYDASRAGVQVDLIVRGACSLIPGVKGLSENIRVISVVDRFLEHSRIYYFENEGAMYLSSADWMPRNFFSRLEVAFPVLDPGIYRYIQQIVIPTYLSDNLKARELSVQGTWKRRTGPHGLPLVRSQFVFEKLSRGEYDGARNDFALAHLDARGGAQDGQSVTLH